MLMNFMCEESDDPLQWHHGHPYLVLSDQNMYDQTRMYKEKYLMAELFQAGQKLEHFSADKYRIIKYRMMRLLISIC